jgi:hypothetical protein
MIPINNSDIAWLIVTDYNQDNNLPYEDLRDDVCSVEVNGWSWEWENDTHGVYGYDVGSVGSGIGGFSVGSGDCNGRVGSVGSLGGTTSYFTYSYGLSVGGHDPN